MYDRVLAQLEAGYDGPDDLPAEGVQTLMLRNLPRSFTSEHVIMELKAILPKGSFDFVYLPWDMRRGSNISFAFVNFVNSNAARFCACLLSGCRWTMVETTKCCRIAAADVQGLSMNLAHYVVNSGSEEASICGPVVFLNGERIQHLKIAVSMFCSPQVLNAVRRVTAKAPEPVIKKTKPLGASAKPKLAKRAQVSVTQTNINGSETIADFSEALSKICQGIPRKPVVEWGNSPDQWLGKKRVQLDVIALAREMQRPPPTRAHVGVDNEGALKHGQQVFGAANVSYGVEGCVNRKRSAGMSEDRPQAPLPVGEVHGLDIVTASQRAGLNANVIAPSVCRPPSPEDIPAPKIQFNRECQQEVLQAAQFLRLQI